VATPDATAEPITVAPLPTVLVASRWAIALARAAHAGVMADRLAYWLNARVASRFESLCVAVPMAAGTTAVIPMSDHGLRSVALTGDYEPEVIAVAKAAIRPGDVVVDVGANIGLQTLVFARLAGPTGRVHSFEPDRRITPLLRAAAELSGLTDRILVHEAAVGSESGTIDLFLDAAVGLTNSTNPGWTADAVPRKVPLVTLDDVLIPSLSRPPALLKIDVEGAESAVLAGAEQLFGRFPPRGILIELTTTVDAGPVLSFLREHGYSPSAGTVIPTYTGARVGEPGFAYANAYLTHGD
jgi:FkbM family methyltransferase